MTSTYSVVVGMCLVAISAVALPGLRGSAAAPSGATAGTPSKGAGPALAAASHQHTPGPQAAGSKVTLPLIADGQVNPELIPENVAYRHFISVTAIAQGASRDAIYKRDTILARVDLTDADRQAYLSAVREVRERLLSAELKIRESNHDVTASDTARAEKGQILDDARARIDAALSKDGSERLRDHVLTRVRTQIRIYGQG
jgi:vacuolar-type H+-ATPase subunit H